MAGPYDELIGRAYEIQAQRRADQQAADAAAAADAARRANLTRGRSIGEIAQDVGVQGLQGAVGLGQSVYGLGNLVTVGGLDQATGFSQNFERTNQILNEAKSAPTQARREEASRAFNEEGVGAGLRQYITSPALLQDAIINAAPTVAATIATGGVAGGAARGATVGLERAAAEKLVQEAAQKAVMRTAGGVAGGSANVEAINQARAAGATEQEQRQAGLGAGIITGLATPAISRLTGAAGLEAAFANRIFAKQVADSGLDKALTGSLVRSVVGGAAKEAADEATQSAVQQVATNAFVPGASLGQGVAEQAAVGGLIGGILGGGFGGLSGPRRASPLRDQIDAQLEQAANEPAPTTPTEQAPLRGLRGVLGDNFVQGPPQEPTGLMGAIARVRADQQYAQNIPLATVDSDTGPLPYNPVGEVQGVNELPVPQVEELTGLNAVLAQQRAQAIPRAQVEELPVESIDVPGVQGAPSLFDAMASVRARQGQLGGTDLFGGTLPEQGAVPVQQAAEVAAPTLQAAETQQALDFSDPVPGWKQSLVKDLGIKPSQARGKDWDAFVSAVQQSGVRPGSAQAPEFLRTVANQLGQNEAGASNFAIKLAEKYGGEAPVQPQEAPTPAAEQAAAAVPVGPTEDAISSRATELGDLIDAEGQGKNNLIPSARRVLSDELYKVSNLQDMDLLRDAAGQVPVIGRLSKRAVDAMFEVRSANVALDQLAAAKDADTLDAEFNSIIQSRSFKSLMEHKQDEIVNAYSNAADQFELGKFSRSEKPVQNAISQEQFRTLTENAARLGTPVEAHDSVAAFTNSTGVTAPPDANGVYVNGKLHLIRENIADKAQLANVLAHERGHEGLGGLLGDRLAAVTNRLWANSTLRPRIRAKMEQGLDRSTAAEEVLADMIAGNERLNKDIVSKLRSGVDNTFATLLGYDKYRVPAGDVDKLLQDTVAYQRAQLAGQGSSVRAESPLADLGAYGTLDTMIGDPGRMTPAPMFSRAETELDKALAQAKGEAPGLTMRTAVAEAYAAGANALKGTASAVKSGAIYDKVLDAMPLDRIASTHGDKNPMLHEIARLKRQKEAGYNKSLTENREVSYGNETFKTSPQEITQEWDAYRRSRATQDKAKALSALQQQATLFRIFPDRSWDQQSKLNYNDFSFTEAERRAAYDKLSGIYKALGKSGQDLYKKTQAVYSDMWNRRFNALGDEVARVKGIQRYATDANGNRTTTPEFRAAIGDRIDSALNKMASGPYSPLQRYGNYMVTVRDKNGKVVWHSGHESAAEADVAAQQLRQGDFKDLNEYAVQRSTRQQYERSLDSISQRVIDEINKSVDANVPDAGDAELRNQLRQSLVEAYLQSLPQHAFLQHANFRKGVAGATVDAFRAFNDYTTKAARNISSLTYDGPISTAISDAQRYVTEQATPKTSEDGTVMPQESIVNTDLMQTVMNAVKRQHTASQSAEISPLVDKLTGAGFAMFMTSPSQMLVNALQTVMVAVPRMIGKYGTGPATREFRTAMSDYARSRGDLLGEKSKLAPGSLERSVMDELHDRGVLDFTQAHDMTGLARADSLSSMSPAWRRVMNVLTWGMNKSEVFNRQVTALAAARLEAKRRNIDTLSSDPATRTIQLQQLTNAAESAVYDTHFDYSQVNAPALTQGNVGRLAFQFQKYRFNMLAMLGKDIYDSFKGASPEERAAARKTLAWLIGMQGAFAGAAGTVFAPIAFAIADAFRDDDDLLDSRTQFIQSTPQWLSHGLLSGLVDVSSRVGGDSLIPLLGDRAYAPKDASAQDTFQYYLMRNLGPWAGMTQDWYKGGTAALSGDIEGSTKALPKPFQDVIKAFYEGSRGSRDANQVAYFEPDAWDTTLAALGLRSGARAEAQENLGATYQAAKRISTLKQRYLGQLAIGQMTGDNELIQQAMGNIGRWNAAQPENAIKSSDISKAIRRQFRSQATADAFGSPVQLGPSTRAQIGL